MSKHTPGPWKTERLLVLPAMSIMSGNYEVCRLFRTDGWKNTSKAAEANAALICAAPEMLATLKALLVDPEVVRFFDCGSECRVRDLINKAERKEPS